MSRNGSGSAEIYIDKNAYSEQYADVSAFTSYVSQVIYNFNVSSGDDDILSLDSVSETQDSYIVGVSYRRVDNVKGLGDFTWSDLIMAGEEGSELNGRLGSFSRGNLRCTLERRDPAIRSSSSVCSTRGRYKRYDLTCRVPLHITPPRG